MARPSVEEIILTTLRNRERSVAYRPGAADRITENVRKRLGALPEWQTVSKAVAREVANTIIDTISEEFAREEEGARDGRS